MASERRETQLEPLPSPLQVTGPGGHRGPGHRPGGREAGKFVVRPPAWVGWEIDKQRQGPLVSLGLGIDLDLTILKILKGI